jgi:Domain of unknown function (DUF5666)
MKNCGFTSRLRKYTSLLVAILLAGCGGELAVPDEGGTGSVPPDDSVFVAIGPVTNVNPLTVNNVTFNTAAAVISIEAGDDDGKGLQVGMVARVNGRTGSKGANPQAFSVSTGAELRGPIAAVDSKTQTFLSVGVVVETNASTQFEGFSNNFNSMGAGDYVQVHGYPSGDGRIRATLIKKRTPNMLVKVTANVGALPTWQQRLPPRWARGSNSAGRLPAFCSQLWGACESNGRAFANAGHSVRPRNRWLPNCSAADRGQLREHTRRFCGNERQSNIYGVWPASSCHSIHKDPRCHERRERARRRQLARNFR